jgi:hypothetical protein
VFSTSLDNSTTPSAAGAKSLRPLFKCSLYNLQDTASRSKDVEIAEIYQYIDMAEWGGGNLVILPNIAMDWEELWDIRTAWKKM